MLLWNVPAPDQALLIHTQQELGVDPTQLPSPRTAASSSLASFSVGALLPLLPYLLGATSLVFSAVLVTLALGLAVVLGTGRAQAAEV